VEDLAEQLRGARSAGAAFMLHQRLLLQLSGADCFRYLNGQITRDLRAIREGEALPACILTPKGKLCAPLLIHRQGEDLVVEADPAVKESLIARLERYIVADDVAVTIKPTSPGVHFFGLLATTEPWASAPGIRVSRLGVPGVDIDIEVAKSLGMPPVLEPRVVESLRIERCIPIWGSELSCETLPPEALLDRTHIDYDRGCYPGQEVISRLKSIGRVNRLLVVLTAASGSQLLSGASIVNCDDKEIGVITSTSEQFDTSLWLALGIVSRTSAEVPGTLFALDPLTGSRTPISISVGS